jgi:hypothetical protein
MTGSVLPYFAICFMQVGEEIRNFHFSLHLQASESLLILYKNHKKFSGMMRRDLTLFPSNLIVSTLTHSSARWSCWWESPNRGETTSRNLHFGTITVSCVLGEAVPFSVGEGRVLLRLGGSNIILSKCPSCFNIP